MLSSLFASNREYIQKVGDYMTVGELMKELNRYDEHTEIVIRPRYSIFVDKISDIEKDKLLGFRCENENVVVIATSEQLGVTEKRKEV